VPVRIAAAPQERQKHVGIHKSLNKGKAAKPAHPLPKSVGKPAAKATKPKASASTPARTVVHKAMASAKVARPAARNTDILTKLRAAPAPAAKAAASASFKANTLSSGPAAAAKSPSAPALKPVAAKAAPGVAASSPAAMRPVPSVSPAAPQSAAGTMAPKLSSKPLDQKVPLMPSAALKVVKSDKPELKPEAKKKLEFRSQDWVVYPAHGVGRIVSIEENEVAGMKLELFVISFEKDKMTLRVPVAKARAVGMRRLSSPDVVQSALATLKGRARIKRTMWSRRAQEYEQKIHSGDLISIAEVVRDLHRASGQPEQSYSERQLYEAAIGRLAREVAAVERIDEVAALKRLETALVKAAA
jgi:CarD family transcriptional regulator